MLPREIVVTSVTTGTPTTTTFIGDVNDPNLSTVDDFYNGMYVRFESGPAAGQARLVTDYAGGTRTFTFGTAFTVAPTAGNVYEVLPADSGAAYVFRHDGTTWFQQAKLVPTDSVLLDMFGRGVAVEAGTILVGAPNGGLGMGQAYRFDRTDAGTTDPRDDTWAQTLRWRPRDGALNDKFGSAVALEGTRAVVTSLRDDDGATQQWLGVRLPVGSQRVHRGRQVGRAGPGQQRSVRCATGPGRQSPADRRTGWRRGCHEFGLGLPVAAGRPGHSRSVRRPVGCGSRSGRQPRMVDDAFGTGIALSGDTFVVGDPFHDFQGANAGTAQVFVWEDLAQATFETFFVPRGTGGLSDPRQMLMGEDGMIYVASATSSRVLRYDGVTGAFVDVFVTSNSGGLEQPEGLAFGPDVTGDDIAELYVTSRGTDEVLIYSGADGRLAGGFVALGVMEPTGIVITDRSGDGIDELVRRRFRSDNVVQYDFDPDFTDIDQAFVYRRHLCRQDAADWTAPSAWRSCPTADCM